LRLTTEYPIWLIVFCLALAGAGSYLLYRNDKSFKDIPVWAGRIMIMLRFTSVFIITLLLLSPLIRSLKKYIEKPVIILAQDNSESVVMNKDSAYYRKGFKSGLQELAGRLSEKYEVNSYSFGHNISENLKLSFNDKNTDISSLFGEIKNRYVNRNVGALILSTDGIYNEGSNPVYSVSDFDFPVFSIALGDTNVQKDIILSDVNYNKIVFLGNRFPIQSVIDIKELNGSKTILSIIYGNKAIFSEDIYVNSDSYSETVTAELEAKKTGLQHYRISLSKDNRESNVKNNYREIVIEVIDSRQKILILSNSPHPDIGAIRESLNSNENFEVQYYSVNDFQRPVKDFNLVILHELPSNTNSITNLLQDIFKNEIPVLFIVGSQSSVQNLNNLKAGINIINSKESFEETQASWNDQYQLFGMGERAREFFNNAPPLISPFGNYSINSSAQVLFYQKIKSISTLKPLVFFSQLAENKVGFITGEGIWRWKMFDYAQNSNHEIFNELINKIVQYLALKLNREPFNVFGKNIFNENEPVIINAELYNQSYELVNEPDVFIEILNSENFKYKFIFNKTSKSYRLNAGVFPVGDYTFSATVNYAGKNYSGIGKFSVVPVNIESTNTVADHKILYQMSVKTNGRLYNARQLDSLYNKLINSKEILPVSYSEQKLTELINLKLLFLVIVVLIGSEWFIRKYFGSY
jgi:hypothetical protein